MPLRAPADAGGIYDGKGFDASGQPITKLCADDSVNHGMLIVGYNKAAGAGTPGSYWKIKNSWLVFTTCLCLRFVPRSSAPHERQSWAWRRVAAAGTQHG